MLLLNLLVALLLQGCTTIDFNNHVDGWPVMKQEVHVVSSAEMHYHCDKYAGFLEVTLACSEIYFNPPLCRVWVTKGGGWAEEHERGHCLGYEHPGSDSMKKMLANFNGKKKS